MADPDAPFTLLPPGAPYHPLTIGWRKLGGSWISEPFENSDCNITVSPGRDGRSIRLAISRPTAAAIDIAIPVPASFQAFGGGERFETLDLRGQSVRYYLENFGLGNGTYLPSPWIATTLGYAVFLPDEAPAVFHIAASFDPNVLRIQVEGDRLELEIHCGNLGELYKALIGRIGPPLMPEDSFFGLWKAGDWRFENAKNGCGRYRRACQPWAAHGHQADRRLLGKRSPFLRLRYEEIPECPRDDLPHGGRWNAHLSLALPVGGRRHPVLRAYEGKGLLDRRPGRAVDDPPARSEPQYRRGTHRLLQSRRRAPGGRKTCANC